MKVVKDPQRGTQDTGNVLFEMGYGGPVEVRMPIKFPLSDTAPLFTGNAVSKPIVVCKEGTYAKPVEDASGRVTLKKFTFTKKDLQAFVDNAARDVPLNVDHWRGGYNHYGWVRTKTGEFKVDKDEDGKWALFAQLEATPETLEAIEKGMLRDFSPEIRPYEKRLVGLALTNYPVMQELHQFTDVVEEDHFTQGTEMNVDELKQQQLDLDRKLGELKALLEASEAARKQAEREARTARLALEFSDKVGRLVKDEKGHSRISPAAREAVLALYLFAAEHDEEVSFSEEGKESKLSPVALLDKVFAGLPGAALFTQETPASATDAAGEDAEMGDFNVEETKKLARARLADFK